jgi:hypothetical protein
MSIARDMSTPFSLSVHRLIAPRQMKQLLTSCRSDLKRRLQFFVTLAKKRV